jgi:hypothetical protein
VNPAPTDPADPAADASALRPAYHPFRQLAVQGAAAILVLSLAWPYYGVVGRPYDWPVVCLLIGITASVFARLAGHPVWWRIIHLFFAPLAWLVAQVQIDPAWFLVGFILLFMLFRGAITGQIPLYLTGAAAVDELADLIERRGCTSFCDLGAGIGSAIVPLARALPACRFTGVEYSPLTYAIGWLRTRGLKNVEWRYADLWTTPLGKYDIVYAFLSPAPMEDLGAKVGQEMRADALFVSNSFPVPDRPPEVSIPAGARTLYGYSPALPGPADPIAAA